jgi:hypothetical protein
MSGKAFSRAVLAVLIISGARPALAQSSLADLARQEQERRKQIEKPSKVLTNEDLRSAPPVIQGSPAGAPAEAAKEPAAAEKSAETKDQAAQPSAADKGAEPKDQAYWSGRQKTLQTQLERDQTFAVALQSRISALTTQYVNQSDPVQQAAVATERQNAITELNRLTKQIEDDKKALADLQEEARRAGVPPGWLR